MEDVEGLNRLFFELSSESRLGILRELGTKDLKMQEITRQLDLTTTDAFRPIQRLSEASPERYSRSSSNDDREK